MPGFWLSSEKCLLLEQRFLKDVVLICGFSLYVHRQKRSKILFQILSEIDALKFDMLYYIDFFSVAFHKFRY